MKAARAPGVRAAIIRETKRAEDSLPGAVVIARVDDPARLLDGSSRALHKDVVDALVDLAVTLLNDEGHEASVSLRDANRVEAAAADFLDDRALEARTGIKRVTWQKYRARGDGPPFYKVYRKILYRWSEVVAWIEARRVGS